MMRRAPRATNNVDLTGPRLRVSALRRPKPEKYRLVNTTSTAKTSEERGLSPFNVGPVPLYGGRAASCLENAWQYSKVYPAHTDGDGNPTAAYRKWAEAGWANPKAVRAPMGHGTKPLYCLWDGERLGYIEARHRVYAPLYAGAVVRTPSFRWLEGIYRTREPLGLVDFDGSRASARGYSLREVINLAKPKMGHAFVLAGLLTGDRFWEAALAPAPAPAPPPAAGGTNVEDGDLDELVAQLGL